MTILLILSLLLAVPVSAAPQYKQSAGNPSLNVNATQSSMQKKTQAFQPQQIQQQKKQSVATTRHRKQPVQYLENDHSNQLTVPMQSTSALRDGHSATPSMTPTTASYPQAVGSSAAAPLYQTSEQGRKGATANWGGMSGGASAEGLMTTGSRYVNNDNANGSAPTPTVGNPTGPRKVSDDDNPEIPFPDPIGDALIPLALLALAYVAFMLYKKKKEA